LISASQGTKKAPAPRPNKRQRITSSNDATGRSKSKPFSASKPTPDDAAPAKSMDGEMDEFMRTMKPRTKKGPAWTNDEPVPAQASADQFFRSKKTSTLVPDDAASPDFDASPEASGTGMSDLNWLRQRMSGVVDQAGKIFDQSDDEMGEPEPELEQASAIDVCPVFTPFVCGLSDSYHDTAVQEDVDPVKKTILETSRLFVRNLVFSCTEDELRRHFEPFGEVSQVSFHYYVKAFRCFATLP
jgi:multiple RNA-binding domain-containing protein 1